MHIIQLPEDILAGNAQLTDEIVIHDYSATSDVFKGRCILNRNAISLVKKGSKTMHFVSETVQAHEGEIHFLSVGNCIASIDLSKQSAFRSILLFFSDEVLLRFLDRNEARIGAWRQKIKIRPAAYVSLAKDAFIHHYISSLDLLIESGRPLSPHMREVKLEELLQYLLEAHPTALLSFQTPTQAPDSDKTFKKLIESNITSDMGLPELAFLCHLSLSSFKRKFLRLYQTSPANWFLEQKMKMAARMLQQKERPSDIYSKLGYENHSSFSKSFRKFYGHAPKAFAAKN